MSRFPPVAAILVLALGAVGIAHTTWLDATFGTAGVALETDRAKGTWRIAAVDAGSPAERAGLAKDLSVVRVSDHWGRSARGGQGRTWTAIQLGLRAGDVLHFEIAEAGAARDVDVAVGRQQDLSAGPMAIAAIIAGFGVRLLYFGVGAALILLRPRDPRSLLLGLFCIAVPQGSFPTPAMIIPLREAICVLSVVRNGLILTAIAHFALVFPAPLLPPRSQRWAVAALYLLYLPVGISHALFTAASAYGFADPIEARGISAPFRNYSLAFLAVAWLAAAVFLVLQYRRADGDDARRRLRVVLLGFGATFLACMLVGFAIFYFLSTEAAWRILTSHFFELALLTMLAIFPLTVAWAVVRHRMFNMRVIVRRTLQYALARRVILTLLAVPLVVFVYALGDSSLADLGSPRSLAMLPLAALLVGAALYKERILSRLDRRFFREAYDARRVLLGLADRARVARDPVVLARDLEISVNDALHPTFARLHGLGAGGSGPSGRGGGELPPEAPALLEQLGGSLVLDADSRRARSIAPALRGALRATGAELLVALPGRSGGLLGILAVGPKRSGEPYAREDVELLETVGRQYAAAYENLLLEREVRTTREAEEKLRGEIEMAREVQSRLLPDGAPRVAGVDLHGVCHPARVVGGDYFDFLPLADGRLGVAVADVSGKGLAAAMLMSNLQAGLRTAIAAGVGIGGALAAVNTLLCDLTSDNRFASFFFGVYDPRTGALRYVNAGHNAPLLVRAAPGRDERLPATAPVLGVLTEWRGAERDVALAPGDALVVYTDGLSEAMDGDEREFGESGVGAAARQAMDAGANAIGIAAQLIGAVHGFASGRPFADDLTLVVVRRTAP